MEDWALIRRLVADGVPQRQVARDLGVGRSTVARALASDRPPKCERAAVPTSFTPFEPLVRQLLATTPDMPATVIAERVGWTGSITWFRDNVRRLRPDHRPVDPSDRLTWLPGDAVQCDLWFPPKKIPLEDGSRALLPVMVMTAAHSRFMVAKMIPTRHTQDLLLAMWVLLRELGRVPRRLIWDNESGIGRGKRHSDGVGAFTGTLATTYGSRARLRRAAPAAGGAGAPYSPEPRSRTLPAPCNPTGTSRRSGVRPWGCPVPLAARSYGHHDTHQAPAHGMEEVNGRRLLTSALPHLHYFPVNTSEPESWTIRHFSQSNPKGVGEGDVPALLRRVADTLEDLGPVKVTDLVLHNELTDDGEDWYSITVYFDPRTDEPD
ncbi:helix-turn-helix domain-containing protein [Kribbella karoonensis]|uniref:helix-turn-helix domain-containing protein n=1 Tax=Kribbella karoonensis TaxID=324851 RepID=UPI0031E2A4FD